MNAERGFTLLEVMIALVIFALLSATVLSASQFVLRQSGTLQERLFAAWLADNQLNELRLQDSPAPGRKRIVQRFDRRDWSLNQWIEPVAGGRLLKVELEARPSDSERVVHRVSGWLQAGDR